MNIPRVKAGTTGPVVSIFRLPPENLFPGLSNPASLHHFFGGVTFGCGDTHFPPE
jgi:hypothetical protein